VRIHLAAEHALQLEVTDLVLEGCGIALDGARGGFVVLAFRQLQQLLGIGDALGAGVELGELGAQACAFAPQLLGFVRLVPDAGIFQLAIDFLEPFFLAVVLKETP
jgi:hypothetical protein